MRPYERLETRLRKLCGMMGSAHDGERASAAEKADQLLRKNGLRWSDVLRVSSGGGNLGDDVAKIDFVMAHFDLLDAWGQKFARSLDTTFRHRKLTEKQRAKLN